MSNITPTVVLIILIVVIIVAIFLAWWIPPDDYKNSRFKIFGAVLLALSIFVTFIFYYSVVELQEHQQKIDILAQTTRITDYMRDIDHQIHKVRNSIPSFILSLNPKTKYVMSKIEDESSPENIINKQLISRKIFTLWELVVLSMPYIALDTQAYVHNFLEKAHSDALASEWDQQKASFGAQTREFGDLLFEYNAKHKANITHKTHDNSDTPIDIHSKMTQDIMADIRFRKFLVKNEILS